MKSNEQELVSESKQSITFRMKVPGGWVVRVFHIVQHVSEALTFVPDPKHKWKV